MKLFCHEDGFCAYRYCCGHCSCVHFPFFSLRCKSDDLCVSCVTRDNHYVIIQRRGTEQEKQTLVSDAGGAIFTGGYFSVSRFVFVLCNVNVQTMGIKMITNLNCFISNVFVSMHG